MASSSNSLGQRPCLCTPPVAPASSTASTSAAGVAGSTSASTSHAVVRSPSTSALGVVKCKQCRAKPKFSFLRNQRSLDLVGEASSPARAVSKETEASGGAGVGRTRRTRSAERYEGMRVNDRGVIAALPRQTSLQTPLMTSPTAGSVPPPISSPPPSYDAVVGKGGLPPSYDEYLSQKRQLEGRVTPPPPWSLSAQLPSCPCERCSQRGGRQLRVALPPEQGVSRVSEVPPCQCSKCQPSYSPYSDTATVNTAVLISLDTTTAMHSVLADGIALCSVM